MPVGPAYACQFSGLTVIRTPAVPSRVTFVPLGSSVKTGLLCELTVYLGIGALNSITKRSKPVCPPTRTSVTVGPAGFAPEDPEPPSNEAPHSKPAGGDGGGLGGGVVAVALCDAVGLGGGLAL
jgi:hypothetical protein